ncbi:MAG: LamG domain-containing protein [Candidatus Poribacteria bacterium]|nr:LamG domain-containing protein [Candidatus Poribacteria bacterium]
MFKKERVCRQKASYLNNPLFVTITFFLLAFLVWTGQPADAIIGAVEDGLIAYWTFDKDTVKIKTEAVDLLSGLAAVVHGDPELAPAGDCKVGECILFDGSVDRFLVEDSKPPTIDRDWDEITLECWAFINALDDSWNRIISLDDMPTNSAVASLYYDDDDNQHGFFVRAGGKSTVAAQDNVLEDIPIEEWLHLTGTYDGETVHYYVNGKLEKKYAMKGGKISKGGLLLGIGDRSDGCDCDTIQGYIDEFRIYDRVLSSAEVQNNMKATGLDVSPSADHLSVTWGHIKARRR